MEQMNFCRHHVPLNVRFLRHYQKSASGYFGAPLTECDSSVLGRASQYFGFGREGIVDRRVANQETEGDRYQP